MRTASLNQNGWQKAGNTFVAVEASLAFSPGNKKDSETKRKKKLDYESTMEQGVIRAGRANFPGTELKNKDEQVVSCGKSGCLRQLFFSSPT